METEVRELYTQMLGGKPLPPLLIEAYDEARYMYDRVGGGSFTPQSLVMIAMAAGIELPKPGKKHPRIVEEENELMRDPEDPAGTQGVDVDGDEDDGESCLKG